ncbi:hypothetical protein ACLB2K_000473 [Fragaria x ananassa]
MSCLEDGASGLFTLMDSEPSQGMYSLDLDQFLNENPNAGVDGLVATPSERLCLQSSSRCVNLIDPLTKESKTIPEPPKWRLGFGFGRYLHGFGFGRYLHGFGFDHSINEYKYPNSDILNAGKGSRASWAWSSLLDGKVLIVDGARWQCSGAVCAWFASDLHYKINLQAITTFDLWFENIILMIFDCKSIREEFLTMPRLFFCFGKFGKLGMLVFEATPIDPRMVAKKAAWIESSKLTGICAIAHDSQGSLFDGATLLCRTGSMLEAEATAAAVAIDVAKRIPSSPIILESDSKTLVDNINISSSTCDWRIAPIVSMIRNSITSNPCLAWFWIPRKANSAADLVTSLVVRRKCP